MAFITIFLAVVSVTTPTLEQLSQRTEPWVREDFTITSVSEFHTSDFLLRENEPVLLLHHAFLDDENEALRTVVCTDTRMIVLEEGFDATDEPVHLEGLAGLVGGSLQGTTVGAASVAFMPGFVGVLDSLRQEGQKKIFEKEA